MSAINIIQRVARKLLTQSQPKGVITIPNRMIAEAKAGEIAATLQRAGLSMDRFDDFITSETDLVRILNQIEAFEKKNLADNIRSGIRNTESAKVFDLEGKEIPRGSKIMGGKEVKNESGSLMSVPDKKGLAGMEYELPPPGSRGGKDDIAAPVQSSEETLKNMIVAENKKNIAKMRQRKMLEEAIDDASPGFANDIKYDAELVAENLAERMGLVYDDLPTKQRLDIYDKAYTGLSKKKTDPEKKADGGRIGLKGGADASQFDKSPSEQRSVDISPSGGVTLGSEPPEGPDDRGSDRQNAVQYLVTQNYTPKEIKRIIEGPNVIDKIKESRFNNPFTRGILRTGLYTLNPSLAGIDFRKALQAKDLYDYAMNQINNPTITEEDMQFAKGGRAGFFMGSKLPKGLATLRQMLNYYGKKSDAVKNPSDILKIVNPKRLNKMLDDPNIYRKFDIEKGLAAPEMVKILQKQMMGERKKTIEEMLGSAKNIKKLDDDTSSYKNEMIEDMMKKGIDRKTAERMADTITEMAESAGLGKFKDTPKLTDEGILELENILKNMETGGKKKRDLNADGGRIGLKDGMNRRTFLKLLGGLASIPIIGKIIKPLKTLKGVKNVPIIKTDNVPGKPEWFDQLVNKVIIEGDDVTKKLATVEREIVHTKKINDTDQVTVYQDLNTDSVRVEYNSPNNMFEESVDLSYIKTLPDEGAPKGSAEFQTSETGIVGRADGPDDYSLEAEGVGGQGIKDLDSDVSALKEYATGEKLTIKELSDSMKRKKNVKYYETPEGQTDYVTTRQGDYDPGPEEFQSGGIARMLGE